MYYSFFGLTQPPFKITPDTDVFFEGGNRGAILDALLYAITSGEGIVKVTGEVGSGKTMLCRVLQTRLPANVETVYLANPSVTPDEILHAIAFEMHLNLPRDSSRLQAMHTLNDYLLERHAQKKQVVVFVEESQAMPISTLEEVRLLSNLETQQHKLLQIVLFGQPELDVNLRQTQIRQLRERISHSFTLAPLNENDVRAYLGFRLRAAGYRGPDLFGPRVIAYMTRHSGGLSRRINLIADKALLAAFADATHNVSLRHVKAAVADSEFSVPTRGNTSRLLYALGGLVAGGLLGVAAYAAYHFWFPSATPTLEQSSSPATDTTLAPSASPGIAASPPAAIAPQPVDSSMGNDATSPSVEQQPKTLATTVTASVEPVTPAADPNPSLIDPSASSPASSEWLSVHQAALPDDWVEQRLLATQQWLEQSPGTLYTIQLLGTRSPDWLRDHFESMTDSLELEKIYVYRTMIDSRPSYTVLYGEFPNKAGAYQALRNLPELLKLNQPYHRTIQGVRSEMARVRS